MYLRYVAQFDNLQIHLYTRCEHVCLLVRPICLSVCLSVCLSEYTSMFKLIDLCILFLEISQPSSSTTQYGMTVFICKQLFKNIYFIP